MRHSKLVKDYINQQKGAIPKQTKAQKDDGIIIRGSTFTFTGFRDSELASQIQAAGGYANDRFSKSTNVVVAADPYMLTGKVKKANESGIPVVSRQEMFRIINGKTSQSQGARQQRNNSPAAPRATKGNPIEGGVLLAKKWEGQDPTGMLASPKLDGVRAYWNGNGFFSRNGNEFIAPAWLTDLLPEKMHLDGELYMGPGKLYDTISVVKTTPPGRLWSKIRFMVFDAPRAKGTFRERMKLVEKAVKAACANWLLPGECPIVMVEQTEIRSPEHFGEFHKRMTKFGVEGTMLRDPESAYERRRSSSLLKVKDFLDGEGKIIGFEASRGQNTSRVGAYVVEDLENGAIFTVDARHAPKARKGKQLKVGDTIEYKFQERTPSGNPRHPILVGVRDYE